MRASSGAAWAGSRRARAKRRNVGSRVKTAEDFIRYCATESSMSGKPSTIRLADGRVVRSGEYLTGELEQLRANGDGGE